MALYSQRIKTRDFDPSSFVENQSVTFKIPNNCSFYPNLRLANLGYASAGDNKYNTLAGVYSCIKHIRLTSDGQLLSQLRFANAYLGFKQLNNGNSDNNLVNSMICKNGLGFETHFAHNGGLEPRHRFTSPAVIANNEEKLGWLDIRKCCPLLTKLNSLDTRVFKNLVLHVEFETRANILLSPAVHNNQGNDLSAVAITIGKPVLIMDEIEDMALADRLRGQLKAVVWDEVEHDRANVRAVGPTALGILSPVQQTFKLNGFSGKFINRIMFRKMFSRNTDGAGNADGKRKRLLGELGSVALNNESWNYRIDGAKVFPADLDRESQRLKLLSDTYGKMNIPPFSDREVVGLEYLDDRANHNAITLSGVPRVVNEKQGIFVGNLSYVGFGINQKVNDFQVDFQRNATSDNRANAGSNNEALEIHAYAEVRKSISINNDGSFLINYV